MKKWIRTDKNKNEAIRLWKIRSCFTLTFFSIIFPFFFIIPGIFYLLAKNGITLNKIPRPMMVVLLLGLLCFILGYIISLILMNDVFNPLEQISIASKKIAKGDYNVHIDRSGHLREIEDTIENFNFMAKELNSVEIMRNDFIANVSHEFKTPLSSITGYVTLLQDPDLSDSEREEYIQMVFFNIEKLNDLTGNILQISRLENQTSLPEPVTYRLDEQIREAVVLLEPKWSNKRISFNLELPELYYTGQSTLLLQVWTNLISNAIKFSNPDSAVSISLHNYPDGIEVVVSDEGIGMSEETISHIFEKFYQGDSSRKEQGNGLGLAICKTILELCNGSIYASGEPGKGSVFMVKLYQSRRDS